ncbi:MAG TPA: type II toxin-antitoxin system VapC family toxin [Bryobacteraceae bacterium]
MIAGVADTHAALWYLLRNPTLSATARLFMDDAAATGQDIVISPISLAEIVYLIEKNRLPASAYEDLKSALADPEYVIEEAPFNGEIVEAMLKVSRADVPDMPDRIVAATAMHFGVPVISRDGRIRSSSVKTI